MIEFLAILFFFFVFIESKRTMWSHDVLDNITSGKLDWEYTWGEYIEFWDEVKKRNWSEARKEWDDLTGCTLVWFTGVTGISLPLLPLCGKGAAKRWKSRLVKWELIFESHDVEFDRRYLSGGGNYRKKHKVTKALRAAEYKGKIKFEELGIEWEE